jgi:hypothetical protein
MRIRDVEGGEIADVVFGPSTEAQEGQFAVLGATSQSAAPIGKRALVHGFAESLGPGVMVGSSISRWMRSRCAAAI